MNNKTSSKIVKIVVIATIAVLALDIVRTIPTKTYDDGRGNLVIGMVLCRKKIPIDSMEIRQFPPNAYAHCIRTNGTSMFHINSGRYHSKALGDFREYTNSRKNKVLFVYGNEKYIVNDWRIANVIDH
ncbi:MAG: PH domain-containing protein [Bacteroidales bacterium]|nr:PH domain-containing protein [Bacteroidales bacterium]MCI2144626.1 PH domain-containing protein [Bacteroidales bacterium]